MKQPKISPSPVIKWFTDITPADSHSVGTKTLNLAKLYRAGLPVPQGFCITTEAFLNFAKYNNLPAPMLANNPDNLAEQVQDKIPGCNFPYPVVQDLQEAYRQLHSCPAAVRSSATAEDLPGFSFAGQYATYLNIEGIDTLLKYIKKCWASFWSPQAVGYRAHKGLAEEQSGFSVLVQEMIAAEISGVMFTADPLSGNNNQVLVNAYWGLGNPVVKGLVTPDEYLIDKNCYQIYKRFIPEKNLMTLGIGQDKIKEVKVPRPKRRRACLTKDQLKELIDLGKLIERILGIPQDIEWAFSNGRFYILQSRPMELPPTWNGRVKGARWLRTWRLGEWLNEPLSPLTRSLLIPVLAEARENGGVGHLGWRLPRGWCLKNPCYTVMNGYFFSRADINIWSFLLFLFRDPPRMKKALERWNREDLPRYLERLQKFREMKITEAGNRFILDYIEELCRDAGEWWYLVALDGGGAGFMEKIFHKFFHKFVSTGASQPRIDTAVFFKGIDSINLRSQQLLFDLAQEIASDAELCPLFCKSGITDAMIYKSLLDTPQGSKIVEKIHAYLQEYGHQVSSIDILFPTLEEEPQRLIPIIKGYIEGIARDPKTRLEHHKKQRDQATAAVLQKLAGRPVRRKIFQALVTRIQELTQRRETTVFHFQAIWPLIRRALLELGKRLQQNGIIEKVEDIFFLEKHELWNIPEQLNRLPGKVTSYIEQVQERRRRRRWQKQLTPPERVPLPGDKKWKRRGPSFWATGILYHDEDGERLPGIAAAPGKAAGIARVISGPADFNRLQPGDILVTPALTPAFTPLLAISSAVVADAGGVTAHTSILAREYGVPAVVATGIASQVIPDGSLIEVDGNRGIVFLEKINLEKNKLKTPFEEE